MEREIRVPDLGQEEVEVTEILVSIDQKVVQDQGLVVIEGQKTSMEIPSPISGIVKNIIINIGDKIKEQDVIMILYNIDNNNIQTDYFESKHENVHQSNFDSDLVHASPLVRRLVRKLNLNLEDIKGTGPKGRVIEQDVYNFYNKNQVGSELHHIPKEKFNDKDKEVKYNQPQIDYSIYGEVEEIKLSNIQKCSGINLQKNWNLVPHVTQFDEVDITVLSEFKNKQHSQIRKDTNNYKLTFLPFIIKAVACALKLFPKFNCSLSHNGSTVLFKKYINISIAINTSKGLLVPVFKNVINKGIFEISQELMIISNKARSFKLTTTDFQGGCFTISNLGKVGGTHFTPIINVPEVAILGISKTCIKPLWDGKKFIPRTILPLSLSYDHRIIDGVDAALFIDYLNSVLSDIRLLII